MVKRTPIALLVSAIALSTGPISGAHAISCNAGPYIIFFDEGEAYVDKSGQDVLDNVSESAANCGYGLTFIAGHSDGFENASVAMKRARTVRAYLVAHGIPDDDIEMQSFGSSKPRIPVRSSRPEPQNRRVEIMLSNSRDVTSPQ
ncbi:MAG: hypothetical protein CL805_05360 [Citromicrobium sp.]|nr:hypothetical protein [Citromicrobium sp.]MBT47741.1 hypothetical protein [Citromicrobium sp.]|tara:strand:- start:116 stop:550 length:435 start_codon:yes stop_codon:yes gene_type:complete